MSFYVQILPVADRRHAAGEFPLFGVQQIGRMHFLGNVPGIHLVQDVLERRDVLAPAAPGSSLVRSEPQTTGSEEPDPQ